MATWQQRPDVGPTQLAASRKPPQAGELQSSRTSSWAIPQPECPFTREKLHLASPPTGLLPSRSIHPAENFIENLQAMGRTCQGLPTKARRPSQLWGLLFGI